jgi:hypothetical protein
MVDQKRVPLTLKRHRATKSGAYGAVSDFDDALELDSGISVVGEDP